MKKTFCMLLAALLLASVAGSAYAVTDPGADTRTIGRFGSVIRISEDYGNVEDLIAFRGAGDGRIPDGRWLNSNLVGNVTEDTPAELKDDFYLHVNKDWFLETQIPEGKTEVGNTADIDRRVKDWQISLATDESLTGHDAELVRKLYALTDWDYRSAQGIEPILPSVTAIADIDSREKLLDYLCSEKNLARDVPIIGNVWEDVLDASVYTAVIDPMNLILVSPEEYEQRTEMGEGEYALLEKQVLYLLPRFGYSEEEAQTILDRAIEADALFASHMLSRADRNADEEDAVHYYEPEELRVLAGDFPIMDILAVLGMEGGKRYNVSDPGYIAGLQDVFTEENVPLIRDWLLARLVPRVITLLDQDAAQFLADAATEQYGITAETADADGAIALVGDLLPVPLDNLYIQATCSEEKRAEIREIVDEILACYRSMLEEEDWLSDETREKAIEKLDNIHSNVLYPDQLDDWSALDFAGPEEGGSLLEANFKILKFRDQLKAARMDTAVDRNKWDQVLSPADTVNCNYSSQNNSINIMAAFADGEFYRDGMSDEQLLGGIGFVIAHEISHAFDTQGARYDKDGSLANWWTEEDYTAFRKRADRLSKWFDGFIPAEGVNYDGTGVQCEAIADMAAMKCLLTLAAGKENFDYDAFFRQFAISQRDVETPGSINFKIRYDDHPLIYMRVNGTLAQYDDFLKFYGIQEGDGMYIAPEDRVAVW